MTTKRRLNKSAVAHLLVWAAIVVLSVVAWFVHWRTFFPPRWVFAPGGVLLLTAAGCAFFAATLPSRKIPFSELMEMFEPDMIGVILLVWAVNFFLLFSGKPGAAAGGALAAASFCGAVYLGVIIVNWALPRSILRVKFKHAPTASF